eukprot:9156359-Karenia_brevis.AAC.1
MVPASHNFAVETHALYLGLWMGPGAGDKSWLSALVKFERRVEMVAAFEAGLWISCLLYSIYVA